MVHVAAFQTHPRFGEVEHNLAEAQELRFGLVPALIVLPELFATGYAFRDRAEALALSEVAADGPTASWLSRASAFA